MSRGHTHAHGPGHGGDRQAGSRALAIALALTATFMVVEVIGGLVTGSLALLADAGHMLSDAFALAIALVAIRLAQRPATPQRSFGYQRAEILAALFNGVTLVALAALILYGAIVRLSDPPEILAAPMLAVAVAGIAINLASFRVLSASGGESLNVSAATRHVLADLAGSVGAVVAALVVLTTGWGAADPIVAGLIGLLVGASGVPIVRDAVRVLLEQAPAGVDAGVIGEAMVAVGGVNEVHDLHVWSITSGFTALSAHLLVAPEEDCHERRRAVERMLAETFSIEHTTLQTDHVDSGRLLQVEGAGSGEAR